MNDLILLSDNSKFNLFYQVYKETTNPDEIPIQPEKIKNYSTHQEIII
jgi:hypothetical protein